WPANKPSENSSGNQHWAKRHMGVTFEFFTSKQRNNNQAANEVRQKERHRCQLPVYKNQRQANSELHIAKANPSALRNGIQHRVKPAQHRHGTKGGQYRTSDIL